MAYQVESRRQRVPGLDSSSDDSSDDDDGIAFKRARGSKPDRPREPVDESSMEAAAAPASNGSTIRAAGGARPKTRNNIWGNVIAEEVLTTGLTGNALSSYDRTRSVESYDYSNAEKYHKNLAELEGPKKSAKERLGGKVTDTPPEDGEVMEEGGANNPDSTDYFDNKQSVKERLGEYEKVSDVKDRLGGPEKMDAGEDNGDNGTRVSAKDRIGKREHIEAEGEKQNVRDRLGERSHQMDLSNGNPRKRGAKQRLGQQVTEDMQFTDVKERLGQLDTEGVNSFRMGTNKYVELLADDSLEKVTNGLQVNLNEPNTAILASCARELGIQNCIRLMHEVEMIESTGGLLTLAGHRRRTPGGIFLFLVKNDKDLDEEAVKKIFKEDRERLRSVTDQRKKAKRRRNQPNKPKTFEQLLAEAQKTAGKERPSTPVSDDSNAPQSRSNTPTDEFDLDRPQSAPHPDDMFAMDDPAPESDTFGVTNSRVTDNHDDLNGDGMQDDDSSTTNQRQAQADEQTNHMQAQADERTNHMRAHRAEDVDSEMEDGEIED